MSSKSLLEAEHQRIDRHLEAFRQTLTGDTLDAAEMREAITLLRRHIYAEEELVFPPLRSGSLAMAVFVMLRDHGALWERMDTIAAKLDQGAREGLEAELDELVALLAKHNGKEEIVVYADLDTALSADAQQELGSFLEAGALPEGWIAAKAPGGAGTDGMFVPGFKPPFGR